jgi:hypothetical protein
MQVRVHQGRPWQLLHENPLDALTEEQRALIGPHHRVVCLCMPPSGRHRRNDRREAIGPEAVRSVNRPLGATWMGYRPGARPRLMSLRAGVERGERDGRWLVDGKTGLRRVTMIGPLGPRIRQREV